MAIPLQCQDCLCASGLSHHRLISNRDWTSVSLSDSRSMSYKIWCNGERYRRLDVKNTYSSSQVEVLPCKFQVVIAIFLDKFLIHKCYGSKHHALKKKKAVLRRWRRSGGQTGQLKKSLGIEERHVRVHVLNIASNNCVSKARRRGDERTFAP